MGLRHMKSSCVLCVKVKEVNYMFPQGSTQWKVVEGLLIQKSHLEQKTYKKKKIKEEGGDIKHTRRQSVVSVRGKKVWNEIRGSVLTAQTQQTNCS